MSVLSKHNAAGQALGYYFQLERALSWIAKSPAYSYVGIETDDDVVVMLENGEKVLEQDKSSITNYPFSISRKDLWNTLLIWLSAIENDEIKTENTTFYLVTNKVNVDSIAKKIGSANTEEEILLCIKELKNKAKGISGEVKKVADKVTKYSDEKLKKLFKQIRYKSGEETFGDGLRKLIESDLQLDIETPEQNEFIINELIGWLYKNVTEMWRKKMPAFVSRDDFMREKINIQTTFRQTLVNQLIIELGEIPEAQKRTQWKNRYVKQLEIIGCTTDDIYDAIHDYLNAVSKRTQLAKKGYITIKEIEELDDKLEQHWKIISRSFKIIHNSLSANEIGQLIYFEAMDYQTKIGPYDIGNNFLTRGSYHKLSDKQKVGWHPEFKNLLKNEKGINELINQFEKS
jgi:hypothetical protein